MAWVTGWSWLRSPQTLAPATVQTSRCGAVSCCSMLAAAMRSGSLMSQPAKPVSGQPHSGCPPFDMKMPPSSARPATSIASWQITSATSRRWLSVQSPQTRPVSPAPSAVARSRP